MPKPIPFIGPPGQRGTGTTDQRYVNVLFEVEKNPSPTQYPVNCVKRPGLSTSTWPSVSAAPGRGVYHWGMTGNLYTMAGPHLYNNTTQLTSTSSFATSTGRVWFTETHVDTGNRQLIVSDGVDNYNLTSSHILTQIDEADDAQYPTPNLGPVVELDGYLFMAQSNGRIWNTEINTVSSWLATSFLTADTFGGDLEAIHIQKDQIIGFTKNRIEFFFNNGNPTGSPLLRIDQNTLGFGIASKNSLAFSGETAIFVSENSADGDGGRCVYMIASLGKVTEISTPTISRFLAAEGTSISTCTAWMERVAGQLIYVLNLAGANRTFVYSVDSGLWCEWEVAAGGAKFNGIAATSKNGVCYVQDATTGRLYTIQPTVYADGGTTFTVTLQTARTNFGSANRKHEPSLSVIGDNTTGNLAVATSDDDFVTFSSTRNIDMSLPSKRLTRLGAFYSRAHRFTYADVSSFRVQAFVPELVQGQR